MTPQTDLLSVCCYLRQIALTNCTTRLIPPVAAKPHVPDKQRVVRSLFSTVSAWHPLHQWVDNAVAARGSFDSLSPTHASTHIRETDTLTHRQLIWSDSTPSFPLADYLCSRSTPKSTACRFPGNCRMRRMAPSSAASHSAGSKDQENDPRRGLRAGNEGRIVYCVVKEMRDLFQTPDAVPDFALLNPVPATHTRSSHAARHTIACGSLFAHSPALICLSSCLSRLRLQPLFLSISSSSSPPPSLLLSCRKREAGRERG